MKSKPLLLLISILIPLMTGGISGYFTAEGISGWYQTLNAPSFNPPGRGLVYKQECRTRDKILGNRVLHT